MPRAAKKLDFDDVTVLVSILRAIGAQAKKAALTKPQIAELTELPTVQLTAAYKTLLKLELADRIDPPKDMPLKGTYLKITAKGKSYCKAYDLLFCIGKLYAAEIENSFGGRHTYGGVPTATR